ncbi:hypothetical protein DXG01_001983 [Tephrocybe rancida]|nr:hypothetical protein DXG01_001983 [Tephrocybe rancida]
MDAAVDIPASSTQDTISPTERKRPRRIRQRNAPRSAAESSTDPRENEVQNRQKRPSGPPRGDAGRQARSSPSSSRPEAGVDTGAIDSKKRDSRPRNPPRPRNTGNVAGETTKDEGGRQTPQSSNGAPRRGAKFGAGLTVSGSTPAPKPARYRKNAAPSGPIGDDLTSRLTHDLRTAPYPDCPICFNSIHPAQRTWSCSPSIPVIRPPDEEGQEQQYCWTTFHVKCIGEWASTNVKAIADAWRARGETNKRGDWRCPGCQAKREIVPSGYWYAPLYYRYMSYLIPTYKGASAIRPPSHNHLVSQPLTRVPIRVRVFARVAADIHAL